MLQIGDLQHKAVLVTGASSGIGAAVSRAFGLQGCARGSALEPQ
jgi:NAD(P)-dependent dehydrogenase (short-subunit alcohol dehydrogenase family)